MTVEEKREKVRLRNIAWRKSDPQKYLRAAAKYRTANRHKIRAYKLKVKYGISIEAYTSMWHSQSGKCGICGNEETAIHAQTKDTQRLAVDHCHATGKVRELLCQDCNRGLGKFQDDPVRLQKAIDYLAKHSPK